MIGNLRAVLLMGLLTGLFLLIGNAIGGTGGMMIAFIFAIAMNMGAWWFSDSMALRMSGAREADEQDYPMLHRMVEELSARASLPKPRVYVIDTPMPNAFATGRSPQKGAVAFTTGIMEMLDQDELAGVLAHELAHIKNRDTLISSIAATIGGAITMLADMAMWGMMFSGLSGDDEDDGLGGMVGGIVMIIVAPIAAMLIQMAISRSREFTADATGAEIAGDPLVLARALEKIEAYARGGQPAAQLNPATSHLYIIPPMTGGLARLFSTHPDTAERIRRLEAMTTKRVMV